MLQLLNVCIHYWQNIISKRNLALIKSLKRITGEDILSIPYYAYYDSDTQYVRYHKDMGEEEYVIRTLREIFELN